MASECEIGGVGRLMMFGMVVVGMVVVAVVRGEACRHRDFFLSNLPISISHFIKFRFTAIPVWFQRVYFLPYFYKII